MADQKISDLTAAAAVADTDIFYVVKDPSGTPLDRKMTVAQLKAHVGSSTPPVSGRSTVSTDESTTSGTLAALATAQTVSLTTGTKALVGFFAETFNSTVDTEATMGVRVSGATTRAISTDERARILNLKSSKNWGFGRVIEMTGLTAGANVFNLEFAGEAGSTCHFEHRTLFVVDLGS